MKDYSLTLFGEAATQLGTTYAVVSGLVKALGIKPKPIHHNGNAKGLDSEDMAMLRRSLTRPARSRHDSHPATTR